MGHAGCLEGITRKESFMKSSSFQSAREFARRGVKSERAIRREIAEGHVPGFYSGNRFVINATLYLEQIDEECRRNVKGVVAE